jgi:hypothetical protein
MPFQAELRARDQEIVPAARLYLDAQAGAHQVDERSAAALACIVYKKNWGGAPAGFEQIGVANTPGGYDAVALRHPASRSLVLVNRGTEGGSSVADWLENVAILLGDTDGQLAEALDFAAASAEACRGGVDTVVCVGHSLGGALAETQVALLNGELRARGGAPFAVEGAGFASAGYAATIEKLARKRRLPLEKDMAVRMTHYARRADPIRDHPGRSLLGGEIRMIDVWGPEQIPKPGGRSATERVWSRVADPLKNHASDLYYAFFDAPRAEHHVFRYRSGDFEIRRGERPMQNYQATGVPSYDKKPPAA